MRHFFNCEIGRKIMLSFPQIVSLALHAPQTIKLAEKYGPDVAKAIGLLMPAIKALSSDPGIKELTNDVTTAAKPNVAAKSSVIKPVDAHVIQVNAVLTKLGHEPANAKELTWIQQQEVWAEEQSKQAARNS
jgi:hypothetical protein